MKLIESQTLKNLARAYAGECQARVKYEFIEYGARKQGYKALAEAIDKIVYNEFNHARMFYTKIQDASEEPIVNLEVCAGFPFKEKWNLEENLKFGMEDEETEVELYLEFAKVAREEGFKDIAILFENISSIENCHKMLFSELYEQLKNGTMYKRKTAIKWKCSACGYEATAKQAWETCPVCQEKQGAVMLNLESDCKCKC
ncbi:MAG: rubrerythrin family protein [Clostridia bacterium]|nr:rubrerythrin family protein [Clostridia bacterium]